MLRQTGLLLGLLIGLCGCRDGQGGGQGVGTAAAPAGPSRGTAAAVVGTIALPDDHADAPFGATRLSIDGVASGRLESGLDRDVFALELRAGERYDFSLASPGSAGLRLLGPDGTSQLLSGGAREPLRFDAPAGGTHYLMVEPVAGSLDYTLVAARLQP